MRKPIFRTFKTFDRLEKLYSLVTEADEEESGGDEEAPAEDEDGGDEDTGGDMPDEASEMGDEGDEMGDETGEEMGDEMGDEEGTPTDPTNDPNIQADVSAGTFVSDIKKAEYAETLLRALKAPAVTAGQIPQNLQNATTQNADAIISFVTNMLTLDVATATSDESETLEALKSV